MMKISAEEIKKAAPYKAGSFKCKLPDGREVEVQVFSSEPEDEKKGASR
jgi:hypothetical protein